MKIIVYTIMKNEIDNIDEWLQNVKKADGIYVLDTGSTDGSYEYIKKQEQECPNLHVQQKIYENFYFDIARNDNLAMVPEEIDGDSQIICWTMDLDERFIPDWYELTQKTVEQNPMFYKLRYWYASNHDEQGNVTNKMLYDKCHQRKYAIWSKPIHEWLTYGEHDNYYNGYPIISDEIFMHHYQSLKTDRSQYITLCKKRIEDNPFDIEAMNHLAVEYDKKGMTQEVLELRLIQYGRAIISKCNWAEVVAGNIAVEFEKIGPARVESWYEEAIRLNPQLGTYYIKLAQWLCYGGVKCDPDKALKILNDMEEAQITVQEHWKELEGLHSWLKDDTWGLAYSWKGDYIRALNWFLKANKKAVEEQSINGIAQTQYHIDFCKEKLK